MAERCGSVFTRVDEGEGDLAAFFKQCVSRLVYGPMNPLSHWFGLKQRKGKSSMPAMDVLEKLRNADLQTKDTRGKLLKHSQNEGIVKKNMQTNQKLVRRRKVNLLVFEISQSVCQSVCLSAGQSVRQSPVSHSVATHNMTRTR